MFRNHLILNHFFPGARLLNTSWAVTFASVTRATSTREAVQASFDELVDPMVDADLERLETLGPVGRVAS